MTRSYCAASSSSARWMRAASDTDRSLYAPRMAEATPLGAESRSTAPARAQSCGEAVVRLLEQYDTDTVFGIYAPAGTPKDLIAKLNGEIGKAMRSVELKARAGAIAAQEILLSPEAFAVRLRAEHERMGALVRETGLKAD